MSMIRMDVDGAMEVAIELQPGEAEENVPGTSRRADPPWSRRDEVTVTRPVTGEVTCSVTGFVQALSAPHRPASGSGDDVVTGIDESAGRSSAEAGRPRRTTSAPEGRDHRAVVGAQPGAAGRAADARGLAARGGHRTQPGVRGDAAADQQVARHRAPGRRRSSCGSGRRRPPPGTTRRRRPAARPRPRPPGPRPSGRRRS